MATLESLTNPLERLQILPDGMNWRGLWNNTTQFYQNDVVLSPITTAPYLLTGRIALAGGADPSTVPADWTELAPATGGITGLTAGQGISITGTPTIPQINNTGVLVVVAGTGITNTGTASDPILQNTGITALNVATGIGSTGGQTPTLSNTGVLSITAGSGISITGSPNAPTVVNAGVLSVNAGAGISIAPVPSANQPTITNSGVLSITGGTGITVSGPAQTPTISANVGVADPVATLIPLASVFLPIPAGATGANVVALSPTSLLYDHLANGSPDPNGTWILDLGSYCFYDNAPAGGTNSITVAIEDNTTVGGPYTYAGIAGTGITQLNGFPPYFLSLGKFYLEVAAARATGLRLLNAILVSNDTGGVLDNTASGVITATYYPNGIQ